MLRTEQSAVCLYNYEDRAPATYVVMMMMMMVMMMVVMLKEEEEEEGV